MAPSRGRIRLFKPIKYKRQELRRPQWACSQAGFLVRLLAQPKGFIRLDWRRTTRVGTLPPAVVEEWLSRSVTRCNARVSQPLIPFELLLWIYSTEQF
jgi:hypothetical protein